MCIIRIVYGPQYPQTGSAHNNTNVCTLLYTIYTLSNQTTTNFDFSVSLTLPPSLSPPSQPLQLTMKALNSRHAALSGSKPYTYYINHQRNSIKANFLDTYTCVYYQVKYMKDSTLLCPESLVLYMYPIIPPLPHSFAYYGNTSITQVSSKGKRQTLKYTLSNNHSKYY